LFWGMEADRGGVRGCKGYEAYLAAKRWGYI